jgi:formate dehydrogenase subunit delta
MSAHTLDKLIMMANQIARNVTHEADPVGMIADHIKAFWSPRMIAQITPVLSETGPARLGPVAHAALSRLVGQDANAA